MPDKTITQRIARYRKKLKSDRDWARVEVTVPASDAGAVRAYAAWLRTRDPVAMGSSVPAPLAAFLAAMAKRYFWWKTPEDLAASPQRIALQVMDIGSFEDARLLAGIAGEAFLKEAMLHAEPGQLNPRSWAYWHYRLGLSQPGEAPSLPARSFA